MSRGCNDTVSHNYSGKKKIPKHILTIVASCFSIIDSFTLHVNPMREVVLFLFCKCQTGAYIERLTELPKVRQVTCGVEARV